MAVAECYASEGEKLALKASESAWLFSRRAHPVTTRPATPWPIFAQHCAEGEMVKWITLAVIVAALALYSLDHGKGAVLRLDRDRGII